MLVDRSGLIVPSVTQQHYKIKSGAETSIWQLSFVFPAMWPESMQDRFLPYGSPTLLLYVSGLMFEVIWKVFRLAIIGGWPMWIFKDLIFYPDRPPFDVETLYVAPTCGEYFIAPGLEGRIHFTIVKQEG